MCGLEGEEAGEFSTGLDQHDMPGTFIVPMGVPAGAAAVVVPAINEIIAVRSAVQLPAAAGGAKGEGTIANIVDVVTKVGCVVVVQLHVIRKDCSAPVQKTAAICGVVVPNRTGTQIQGGIMVVENAAVLVSFYFEIDTLFDGKGIQVPNTGSLVVVHQDGCAALDHKLAEILGSLLPVKNTMYAIFTCGNIRTALNRELGIKAVEDAELRVSINGYMSAVFDRKDPTVLNARQANIVTHGNRCAAFNGQITHILGNGVIAICIFAKPRKHVETAAGTCIMIAVSIANDICTAADPAFATDTKAGTTIIRSVQSRTAINIKLSGENAKAAGISAISGCGDRGRFQSHLAVIASKTETIFVFGVIGHLNFRRIQRYVNGVQHQARMAAAGGYQTRVVENDLTIGLVIIL